MGYCCCDCPYDERDHKALMEFVKNEHELVWEFGRRLISSMGVKCMHYARGCSKVMQGGPINALTTAGSVSGPTVWQKWAESGKR